MKGFHLIKLQLYNQYKWPQLKLIERLVEIEWGNAWQWLTQLVWKEGIWMVEMPVHNCQVTAASPNRLPWRMKGLLLQCQKEWQYQ